MLQFLIEREVLWRWVQLIEMIVNNIETLRPVAEILWEDALESEIEKTDRPVTRVACEKCGRVDQRLSHDVHLSI